MIEFCCKSCKRLLAKLDETKGGKVFIKCPECNTENTIDLNDKIGLGK